MPYHLDCYHVNTCLPSYVTDHCNGDNEMLVGVPVYRSTRIWQMRQDLADEIHAYGDKLPEDLPDSIVDAAIAECFAGAHPLAAFDSRLEPEDEDDGESCYAWFRFTWSEED